MSVKKKTMAALLTLALLSGTGCGGEVPRSPSAPEPVPSVPEQVQPVQPEPEPEPEPIVKTGQAAIAATGDILMHYPIIKSGSAGDGSYNFDGIFTYFSEYVSDVDYAAANLETTLAGLNNGYKYQGYPRFNCPDGIVDSLKRAGFDMLLTANNHTFDTGEAGFLRTLQVVDEAGLDRIGTHAESDEVRYVVRELNGIKVGMICYTYETEDGDPEQKSLNCLPMTQKAGELINSFHYDRLEEFYTHLSEQLKGMEKDGAQASIVFIHWGNEYQLQENDIQREMAQRICDLGVDVIIGGHPHVVQPVELLHSSVEEDHHTVCLYSMGNAVSNQRTEQIPSAKGYTEDGVLFRVSFARYSDGTVLLEQADLLPTWVNLTRSEESGKTVYEIIPLDKSVEDWKTAFTLTDRELAGAQASYDRTMSIVGEGLESVRLYLENQPTPAQK